MTDHERHLVCTRCGSPILVCCHVHDLDPATYVGLACGCRRPKTDAQLAADKQAETAKRTNDPIPF